MITVKEICILFLCLTVVLATKRHRRQTSTEITAWTGQEIKFLCGEDLPEKMLRFWRKGFDVLAVSSIIISHDERLSLVNNSLELRIANVTQEDAGDYTCVVKMRPQYKHTYHLRVRELICESPEIPLNGHVDISNKTENDSYRFGDKVTYYCQRGYYLAGPAVRACTDPYKGWSGDTPACESEFIARLRNRLDELEKKITTPVDSKAVRLLESKVSTIENRVTSLEGGADFSSRNQDRINDLDAAIHRIRTANNVNIHRTRWEKLLHGDMASLAEKDGYIVAEFTWFIENFEEKVLQHRAEKFNYLESKPFYTNIPGYRIQLHVYPDYDSTGYMGVYAILVPGEFDEVIAWPFTSRYEVSLMSRDESDVVYDAVVPSKVPSCNFEKPPPDNTVGCGFSHFASLEVLRSKKILYMYDNGIGVKISVYLNYT